jgi:hypothetical protein
MSIDAMRKTLAREQGTRHETGLHRNNTEEIAADTASITSTISTRRFMEHITQEKPEAGGGNEIHGSGIRHAVQDGEAGKIDDEMDFESKEVQEQLCQHHFDDEREALLLEGLIEAAKGQSDTAAATALSTLLSDDALRSTTSTKPGGSGNDASKGGANLVVSVGVDAGKDGDDLVVSLGDTPPGAQTVSPVQPIVPPTGLARNARQPLPTNVGAYHVGHDSSLDSLRSDSDAGDETPQGHHDNLVVANPVHDNDIENPEGLPQAEALDTDQAAKREAERAKVFKTYVLLMVIVFAALVMILLAIFIPHEQESGTQTTPEVAAAPTTSPSVAPTSTEQFVLSLLPDSTVSVIREDPESPQSTAFQWLMDGGNVTGLSNDRIKQRFALATIYYATKGVAWVLNNNWLNYSVDECEWEFRSEFGEKSVLGADFVGYLYEMFPPTEPTPTTCNENGLIQHLWMDQNNLDGSLPLELYMLTTLKTLSTGGNRLKGTIATQIGQLSLLEGWSIRNQETTGTIPTEIGLLTNLRACVVLGNDLQGTLPSETLQLTNLETISVALTRLSGPIPSEIGTITKLRWLSMAASGFTGRFAAMQKCCLCLG